MPKTMVMEHLHDMTGGLNLRQDQFNLRENEVAEATNVVFGASGGFSKRKGVEYVTAVGPDTPQNFWTYHSDINSNSYVFQSGFNGDISYTNLTGFSQTSTADMLAQTGLTRAVQFRGRLYMVNYDQGTLVMKNDMTTVRLSRTVPTWFDNIEAPPAAGVNGWMPAAHLITVWQGSIWIADTFDTVTTTRQPQRVRWSHPGFGNAFRSFDFINVDTGKDADPITALVPAGDRLLVFKNRSVHAIFGTFPDFQVQLLSDDIGTIRQESVASSEQGVYFFSWPEGVYKYDGKGFDYIFEPIRPAIENRNITDEMAPYIYLGYGNRKLFVGTPWDDFTPTWVSQQEPQRTLVFDPFVGKSGAWSMWTCGLGPFVEWTPFNGDYEFLAAWQYHPYIFRVERDRYTDRVDEVGLVNDQGIKPYTASVRTHWFDANNPAVRKRFKRPEFVIRTGQGTSTFVDVFVDYDAGRVRRSFELRTRVLEGSFILGTSLLGGADLLNPEEEAVRSEHDRGRPLGSGRAIQLRMKSPTWPLPGYDQQHSVDSVTVKYIPRRVRS